MINPILETQKLSLPRVKQVIDKSRNTIRGRNKSVALPDYVNLMSPRAEITEFDMYREYQKLISVKAQNTKNRKN